MSNDKYLFLKELKAKGFPQSGMENSEVDPNCEGGKSCHGCCVAKPSIADFIRVLGEHCDGIYRGGELGWYATNGEGDTGQGSTPEEALANLWLSLQKPLKK